MEFWDRVEQLLEKEKSNYRWLAGKIKKSETTVSGWRRLNRLPRAKEALAIADAFNEPLSYLLYGTRPPGLPPRVAEMARKMALLPDDCLDGIEANINALYEKQRIAKANSSGL